MVDVLYGEEVSPRIAFEFFRHLSSCPECEAEYLELLETRELLGSWEDPVSEKHLDNAIQGRIKAKWRFPRIAWFPAIQKIAAGFLILVGIFALLQAVGLVPLPNDRAIVVSDQQLAELIHDVMVEKQMEDWKALASALMSWKEQIELQNRQGINGIYQEMDEMKHRYILALEDYNRQVSKLVNQ
jgi:hypothetical protein